MGKKIGIWEKLGKVPNHSMHTYMKVSYQIYETSIFLHDNPVYIALYVILLKI